MSPFNRGKTPKRPKMAEKSSSSASPSPPSTSPTPPLAVTMATTNELGEEDNTTKEFLSCSICWETYDEKSHQPKMLSCHHTFCKACLRRLTKHHRLVTCSTCRKDTVVLDGPSALQTNFYIMYMKQKLTDKNSGQGEGVGAVSICHRHSGQPRSFFCKSCAEMVCRDCIVLNHSQQEGHELQELSEVKAEYIFALNHIRREVDEVIGVHTDYTNSMHTELEVLDIAHEAAAKQTDVVFNQLVDTVNQKRNQIKDQIKESHDDLHRQVNESVVEVERQTSDLQVIRDNLEKVTGRGNLSEIMSMANSQELKKKISHLTFDTTQVSWNNYVAFDAEGTDQQLEEWLRPIGSLTYNMTLPAQVEIIEPATPTAGFPTTITVKVATYQGEPLEDYPIGLCVNDPVADSLQCTLEQNEGGQYRFSFKPQISGPHSCTVTFLEKSINCKLATVKVKSNNPVKTVGTMGKNLKQFMYPCSLTIHPETGDLYVVDEGNQRIQILTDDGEGAVDYISVAGEDRQARTFDVALNAKADQLVCTRVIVENRKAWADTVQVYDLQEGQLLRTFSNDRMKKALYVAVNRHGEIIVPDYHLNCLYIYSGNGEMIRSLGKLGNKPGEFREPAFVCIGQDDDILISDCRNGRIQVLSRTGEYKYEIGKGTGGKGILQGPSGVAMDIHGNVLVTDRVTKRIQVYRYDGTFVSCIDSKGDRLSDPRGLAVTDDGHVYVADQKNHCIKKYKYM